MPAIPREQAIRAMTAAVRGEPDVATLYEVSRDFLPAETRPSEPRGVVVECLVQYLNDNLSPDLVAEFWRLLHVNEYRGVWYNEEDDHIYYTPAQGYDPVGVE